LSREQKLFYFQAQYHINRRELDKQTQPQASPTDDRQERARYDRAAASKCHQNLQSLAQRDRETRELIQESATEVNTFVRQKGLFKTRASEQNHGFNQAREAHQDENEEEWSPYDGEPCNVSGSEFHYNPNQNDSTSEWGSDSDLEHSYGTKSGAGRGRGKRPSGPPPNAVDSDGRPLKRRVGRPAGTKNKPREVEAGGATNGVANSTGGETELCCCLVFLC